MSALLTSLWVWGLGASHRHWALDCTPTAQPDPFPKQKHGRSTSFTSSQAPGPAGAMMTSALLSQWFNFFQISSEPARLTNTHISSGKLSTYLTRCWPSETNYFVSWVNLLCVWGKNVWNQMLHVHKKIQASCLCPTEKSALMQIQQRSLFISFLLLYATPLQLQLLFLLSTQAQKKKLLLTDICNKHADTWDINWEAGIITEPLNQPQDLVSIIRDRIGILQDPGQKAEKQ